HLGVKLQGLTADARKPALERLLFIEAAELPRGVELPRAAVDSLLIFPDHRIEVLVRQRILEDQKSVCIEAIDLLGREGHLRRSFLHPHSHRGGSCRTTRNPALLHAAPAAAGNPKS